MGIGLTFKKLECAMESVAMTALCWIMVVAI